MSISAGSPQGLGVRQGPATGCSLGGTQNGERAVFLNKREERQEEGAGRREVLPTVPMKGSVLCGGAPQVFPRKFCAIAAGKQPRRQEEDNSQVSASYASLAFQKCFPPGPPLLSASLEGDYLLPTSPPPRPTGVQLSWQSVLHCQGSILGTWSLSEAGGFRVPLQAV